MQADMQHVWDNVCDELLLHHTLNAEKETARDALLCLVQVCVCVCARAPVFM